MTNQTRKLLAVFLDRDGVLNEEVGYICRPDQISLIPGVGSAVKRLNESGFSVIVVSNQSAIGRGICSEIEIQQVNSHLSEQLSWLGAKIMKFYYCPHHPTEAMGDYLQTCECRKPNPGMLRQAASDLDLDLTKSVMVGDRLTDIEAGRSVGCRTVLIENIPLNDSQGSVPSDRIQPDLKVPCLDVAVSWILETFRN